MALNFPANPKEGDTHFDASNGVTYTYKNGGWVASAGTQDDLDLRYVESAGDNMTGDLTLGTDKITLKATDGSITAAGTADLKKSARFLSGIDGADGNPLQMWVTGSVVGGKTQPTLNMWNYDQEHQVNLRGDGTLKLGGLLPSSPNITLNANGSASSMGLNLRTAVNRTCGHRHGK